MKIGIDFDDTIVSQYDEVLKILNRRHNLNIDYNKVAYWNWTQDNYDEVTLEEILDIVYNFNPEDCKPVDKYLTKYFNKLYEKHDIDVITARWGHDFLEYDIHDALDRLGLYYDSVILCGRKNKQDYDFDILIDDNPNLAKALIKDWYGGANLYADIPVLILYDRPWNWNIECEKYPFIYRVKNWKQVYEVIRSL